MYWIGGIPYMTGTAKESSRCRCPIFSANTEWILENIRAKDAWL
jgi:predicted nucleotide-binding protein (sugar kinase/HSP70/actin superfamily)